MHILIDMDGVLADWSKQYDIELDEFSKNCEEAGDPECDCKRIPRTKDQKAFNLHSGMNEVQSEVIDMIMDRPGFYADLAPIEGAIAALHEMIELGHEVSVVTSPWLTNPTCVQDKLDWVKRYLGDGWENRVIITKDKTLIDGDILIDDRPDITGKTTPKWMHILFDQPYNQDVTDKLRITKWSGWKFALLNFTLMATQEKPSKRLGANELYELYDLGKLSHEPYDYKNNWTQPQSETRTTSATGGEKGTKPQDYSLIPVLPLDLLAELYHNGAVKYSSHNWRKGYEWSKSYAAAMRHMTSFWNGEDMDPEMGLPHVTSAAFHMFALAQFMRDFPEFDDRYKK